MTIWRDGLRECREARRYCHVLMTGNGEVFISVHEQARVRFFCVVLGAGGGRGDIFGTIEVARRDAHCADGQGSQGKPSGIAESVLGLDVV